MGRKKIQMEYINKDKLRSTTFQKRKGSILKKANELAILCDVPVCAIIYQTPDSDPETFPFNQDEARPIIDRYTGASSTTTTNTNMNTNTNAHTPCLFRLSKEELIRVASHLDSKLHVLREKIGELRGSCGNNCAENSVFDGESGGSVASQPPEAVYHGSLELTL